MTTSTDLLPVSVTLRGNVGPGTADYARSKVHTALEDVGGSVRNVSVVLDWQRNPALLCPARAEASADIDGTLIRAKSVRPTMQEAIDELEDRLRRRVRQVEENRRSHHRRHRSTRHEWRHGDRPRPIPAFCFRPIEEREIVRHKAHVATALTPDEASYEMELLDHDFFLFYNLETGSPAVLRRVEPHTYAVDSLPPELSEAQARERLEMAGDSMVFFIDAGSGEARVLYLRHDGHYGSITLVKS
ncbi:MAG TPA: HPF/RaiA family ribosome-associated protein [Marmoricola sp.]|nr:HPF/RaiA family ribosome-associated protein [Marmoricola sp.]